MKLTVLERLMLSNQYRMMEILWPAEKDQWKDFQNILNNGYEKDYEDVFQIIHEKGFS